MTVCRYFLQGTCRFGDRCRFEHTESNSSNSQGNQRNVGGYQRGNYQQQAQHGNHYQQQAQYGNYQQQAQYGNYQQQAQYGNYQQQAQYGNYRNGYSHNYNPNVRNYSSDRYSENYQPGSPERYYTSSGYRDNRYEYNNYENQRSYSPDRYADYRTEPANYRQGYVTQPQYNEHSYGRNQQYTSNNNRNEKVHGQNKYQWVSDGHKKQSQQKTSHSKEYVDDSYATSTPKAKASFSFKLPESEIKKQNSSQYQVNEQDQSHAELVKEDAKASELGGLWPFTCYFPCSDKHAFPGFCDVSPEELRYAAYKAEENNTYESYVQSVQTAVLQIKQQRSQLQIPTPQLLATLRRIWNGENLYSTPNIINSIPFIQCEKTGIDTIDTPTTVLSTSSAAASFSFKMADEVSSPFKSAATAFSFKLPSGEAKLAVISGDADVYTPMENLTEEEKEQFSASTFVLGKIPTQPPPHVLCS